MSAPTSPASPWGFALSSSEKATWLVIGASRGIGLEWVRAAIARGDQVIAAVRDPMSASDLWTVIGSSPFGSCRIVVCDVSSDKSVTDFANEIASFPSRGLARIDYIVINAGILQYPRRATESSFDDFELHMRTNCVGPIITAQKLLKTEIPIGTIVFMSSDSGSAGRFLNYEDGFAVYAASKAALNQSLRHMAAELMRQQSPTTILAIHPGEVATDMHNIQVGWEIDGLLTPAESIAGMLSVVTQKGLADSGTFWTWEGEVFWNSCRLQSSS